METPENCALPGESRVLSLQCHICPEEELQDHPGFVCFPVNGTWSALDSGPLMRSLVGDIKGSSVEVSRQAMQPRDLSSPIPTAHVQLPRHIADMLVSCEEYTVS